MPDVSDVADLLDRAITMSRRPSSAGANRSGPDFPLNSMVIASARGKHASGSPDWNAPSANARVFDTLKTGYNKVFGYYLEITTAALATAERDRAEAGRSGSVLPDEYIPKQSFANATRYFTPQLKEYETIVLTAQETLAGIEADVVPAVVGEVAGTAGRLLDAAPHRCSARLHQHPGRCRRAAELSSGRT